MFNLIKQFSSFFKKETPLEFTDIFRCVLVERDQAESFAGDLFTKYFHCALLDKPHHFVALYSPDQIKWTCVGYVHFTAYKNDFLCGGLVMDTSVYRKIPKEHRLLIQEQGGVAENLLRDSFQQLPKHEVIWGYVGDTKARNVDVRAGFQETEHQYIMAVWPKDFSDEQKAARLADVIKIDPF